jgi:hypothetical protein
MDSFCVTFDCCSSFMPGVEIDYRAPIMDETAHYT